MPETEDYLKRTKGHFVEINIGFGSVFRRRMLSMRLCLCMIRVMILFDPHLNEIMRIFGM